MALNVGSLYAELSLDITPFNQSIAKATTGVQQMGQQMQIALDAGVAQSFTTINRRLGSLMKRMVEVGDASQAMQKSITSAVETSLGSFKALNDQITITKNNFIDFAMEGTEALISIDDAAHSISGTVKNVGRDMRTATETMRSAYQDMDKPMPTRSTEQATGAMASLGTEASQVNAHITASAGSAKKLTREVTNAEKQMKKVQKSAHSLKRDFQRIIGGILLSQTFYRLTNAIQSSIKAVVEFSSNMETAAISFEYLLGSAERAQGFIGVMKDFAAVTPFSTEDTLDMAKRLMAMGFAGEEVLSVMNRLTDATAATSKDAGEMSQRLDRIVLALGQMKTNGKIAGQELRQLAEVGIPVYQILQKQLGLTAKQVRAIGRLDIPGEVGVKAILDGLSMYEGAAAKFADSLVGMKSTIKDSLKMISEGLFARPYEAYRNFIQGMRDNLEELRDIMGKKGIGGVFERVFPPELHASIRSIIGAFMSLGSSIKKAFTLIAPIIGDAMASITRALGVVLPIVAAFVRGVVEIVSAVMQAAPWIRYLIQAIGGLYVANLAVTAILGLVSAIKALKIAALVAGAVQMLGKAIVFLQAAFTLHPIVAVISLVAAALLALALSSKTVTAWLDALMGRLGKLAGFKVGEVFEVEEMEDFSKWLEEFNKEFTVSEESLEDIEDAAGGAGKGVKKFLAAFDEVFGIPEQLDAAGDAFKGFGGKLPKLPDISVPSIGVDGVDWDDFKEDKEHEWKIKWVIPPIPPIPPIPSPFPIVDFQTALDLIKQLQIEWGKLWERVKGWVRQPIPAPVFEPIPNPVWNPNWGLEGLPKWIPIPGIQPFPNPVWRPNWGLDNRPVEIPLPTILPFPNPVWEPNWGLEGIPREIFPPIFLPIPNPVYIPNWNLNPPPVPVVIFPAINAMEYEKSMERLKEWTNRFMEGFQTSTSGLLAGTFAAWLGLQLGYGLEAQGEQTRLQGILSRATEGFNTSIAGQLTTAFAVWLGLQAGYGKDSEKEQSTLQQILTRASEGFQTTTTGALVTAFATWLGLQAGYGRDSAGEQTRLQGVLSRATESFNNSTAGQLATAFVAWIGAQVGYGKDSETEQSRLQQALTTASSTFQTATTGALTTALATWLGLQKTHGTNSEAEQTRLEGALTTSLAAFGVALSTQLVGVYAVLTGNTETFKTNMGTLATAIGTVFGVNLMNQMSNLGANLNKAIQTISGNFNKLGTAASAAGYAIGKAVSGNIVAGFKYVTEVSIPWIKGMQENMNALGRGMVNATVSWVGSMVSNALAGFRSMWDSFVDVMRSMGERVSGWFRGTDWRKTAFTAAAITAGVALTVLAAPVVVPFVAAHLPALGTVAGGLALGGAFERGGFVNKDQLIRVGEKNKREVVIPLENENYMAPFADAVARRLGEHGDDSGSGKDTRPILYVHTLIADDAGLRELNRQMRVIDMGEAERRGEEWDTALSR